ERRKSTRPPRLAGLIWPASLRTATSFRAGAMTTPPTLRESTTEITHGTVRRQHHHPLPALSRPPRGHRLALPGIRFRTARGLRKRRRPGRARTTDLRPRHDHAGRRAS